VKEPGQEQAKLRSMFMNLCTVRAGATAARPGEDVGNGRSPHLKADCTGEYSANFHAAAIADGEIASWKLFRSQLEPKSGGMMELNHPMTLTSEIFFVCKDFSWRLCGDPG